MIGMPGLGNEHSNRVEVRIIIYSHFCTKLWNSWRKVLPWQAWLT